jgi:hypothetical protein
MIKFPRVRLLTIGLVHLGVRVLELVGLELGGHPQLLDGDGSGAV